MVERFNGQGVSGQVLRIRQMLRQLLPGVGAMALSTNLAIAGQLPGAADTEPMAGLHTQEVFENSLAMYPGISLSELPPELQGEGKWEAFRALWRELDMVMATSSGAEPDDGRSLVLQNEADQESSGYWLPGYDQRRYYRALDEQQALQYRERLHEILAEDVEYLSSESQLLYRLTWLRIQELSLPERPAPDDIDGGRVIMTRMAPIHRLAQVSPTYYLVSAIDRIQMRTNTLLQLRASDAVNDDIYVATLGALLIDAKLALYLDALSGPWMASPEAQLATIPVRRRSVPLGLKPEDFVKPGSGLSAEAIDLRQIQLWQDAIDAAYNRQKSNYGRVPPIICDENARQIKALIQDLSVLRENLDQLDPLLRALER